MAAAVSTFASYFKENKEKTEKIIEELGDALRRNKLADYLKTIHDPDRFALDLAEHWDDGSLFIAILKVCDPGIAVPLLSRITTPRLLNSAITVKRAVEALEIFNQPQWLPVFINVLKINRTRHWNRIDIADLLQRDRDPLSPFYNKLPSYIRQALQVEAKGPRIADMVLPQLFRSVINPTWYLNRFGFVDPYQ